jgi:tubulin polyglutamylase TTLL5
MGHDDKFLFNRINDLIIKTILSVEHVVKNAVDMFCPFKNCCFEVFGFDVLIDQDLKPWLLETNLSPALSCDSPLDLKIKANLISDLFSLAGLVKMDQRNLSD